MTSGTRCAASPACFMTVEATRFARATGDCFRARLRPPARLRPAERLRPDDFRAADPRADDLRRDDLRAADFLPAFRRAPPRPADFRPLDLRPLDLRPRDDRRRPLDRALPRDDRFFVAMAMLSKLRVGCSHVLARIARAQHRDAAHYGASDRGCRCIAVHRARRRASSASSDASARSSVSTASRDVPRASAISGGSPTPRRVGSARRSTCSRATTSFGSRSSTVMMTMRPPGESCRYTVRPCSMTGTCAEGGDHGRSIADCGLNHVNFLRNPQSAITGTTLSFLHAQGSTACPLATRRRSMRRACVEAVREPARRSDETCPSESQPLPRSP